MGRFAMCWWNTNTVAIYRKGFWAKCSGRQG